MHILYKIKSKKQRKRIKTMLHSRMRFIN